MKTLRKIQVLFISSLVLSVMALPAYHLDAKTVVKKPVVSPTALCKDGTYSYAAHHQGACSHHKGVKKFFK